MKHLSKQFKIFGYEAIIRVALLDTIYIIPTGFIIPKRYLAMNEYRFEISVVIFCFGLGFTLFYKLK